jgi:hypothetical protein
VCDLQPLPLSDILIPFTSPCPWSSTLCLDLKFGTGGVCAVVGCMTCVVRRGSYQSEVMSCSTLSFSLSLSLRIHFCKLLPAPTDLQRFASSCHFYSFHGAGPLPTTPQLVDLSGYQCVSTEKCVQIPAFIKRSPNFKPPSDHAKVWSCLGCVYFSFGVFMCDVHLMFVFCAPSAIHSILLLPLFLHSR